MKKIYMFVITTIILFLSSIVYITPVYANGLTKENHSIKDYFSKKKPKEEDKKKEENINSSTEETGFVDMTKGMVKMSVYVIIFGVLFVIFFYWKSRG